MPCVRIYAGIGAQSAEKALVKAVQAAPASAFGIPEPAPPAAPVIASYNQSDMARRPLKLST